MTQNKHFHAKMEETGHTKELSDHSNTNSIGINTKSYSFIFSCGAHDAIHWSPKDKGSSAPPVLSHEAHIASP